MTGMHRYSDKLAYTSEFSKYLYYTFQWLTGVIFWKRWLFKIWEKEKNTAWDRNRFGSGAIED